MVEICVSEDVISKVYGTKSILIINRTTYLYYFMSHTRKVIEHVPPKPFTIYALPVLKLMSRNITPKYNDIYREIRKYDQ